jgi:hypothetical protein
VEGKVLVDGQPLTLGTVILTPDKTKGNESLHEPRGKINAEGVYRASIAKGREGVPPGWYKVSISAQRMKDPKDSYSYESVIPKRYAVPEKSGLSLEVVEKPAAGAYDLKLSGK